MITDSLAKISAAAIVTLSAQLAPLTSEYLLSSHEISLAKRYEVQAVSDVFKDNILLNLAYMEGRVNKASDINWDEVKKPFKYEFKLEPNKTFAYHDDILEEYKGKDITFRFEYNGEKLKVSVVEEN